MYVDHTNMYEDYSYMYLSGQYIFIHVDHLLITNFLDFQASMEKQNKCLHGEISDASHRLEEIQVKII